MIARSTVCLRIVAVLTILLSSFAACAQEQRVSQYAHRAWLARDGFFSGQPNSITQTKDGYIWVGTESGLYRYDGSHFEAWSSPDGRKLPSNLIESLLGASDGSLWIGTLEGLAHLVDHRLVVYPDFHDHVQSLLEDSLGEIWLTHDDTNGYKTTPICRALPTEIHCLGESEGVTAKFCCTHALAQDTEGYLWAATEGALFRWKAGHSDTLLPKAWTTTRDIQTAEKVLAMPDGSVLVCVLHPGPYGGLQKISVGHWGAVKVPGFDASTVTALSAFLDKDSGIWLGTDKGLYHIHDNNFEKFGTDNNLSGDSVWAFYQDREGGIWVATSGGVDYFHHRNVTTFSRREGLSTDSADGVAATRENAVWIASNDALNFLKNGRIDSSIRAGHGLPGRIVSAIFVDSLGRLWSGVDHDLYRYDHGKFHKVSGTGTAHFFVSMAEDPSHDIWAETSTSHELMRIHDLHVVEKYPESTIPSAHALAAGPDGALWLGLLNGDLARFHDAHLEVFPSPGGRKSYVHQVVVNPNGTVFATTSAGLVGWKEGMSHLLSMRNGLPCATVIGAAVDKHGALWLDTQCGLVTVSNEDMDRWWRNDTVKVAPKLLDAFEGVQPGLPNFNPMLRTPDGRLWIANNPALQVVDPAHLVQNDVPPPVQIQKVVADRKSYEPFDTLAFPPLMLDLEIDYAALSFVNPQQVRFRYKLDGRDTAWQEAGSRRQAFYTDLRPGSYHFQVVASNNDGLWNEQGASIDFTVAPTWYQTSVVRISALFAGIFLLWLLYYLRMKQAARSMRARYDERISERTRLARDLHDTLLQTLQGSKLVADDALDNRHDVEYTSRSLEKLSQWIDRATQEGRAALHALHLSAFDNRDLSKRLQSALDDREIGHVAERFLTTNGTPLEMDPLVTDEVCSVAYEAIRNAFLHSHATRIDVRLTYAEDFAVTVRDNGRGMETSVASKGRPGHFGLRTMRERATRMNGQFQITTAPGLGTVVELRVPGKTAYREELGLRSKVFSWIRKLRGTEA